MLNAIGSSTAKMEIWNEAKGEVSLGLAMMYRAWNREKCYYTRYAVLDDFECQLDAMYSLQRRSWEAAKIFVVISWR